MSKIVKLDVHLSNMIAAGEVVEKISSVVKELVENSLDAGATNIEVRLTNSGMKEIEVIDNGSGMEKEDVKLCFLRHATSKIKNQYDLYRINTLGFRGEAIPSIASVSDIVIKSSTGEMGYFVHMKATKVIEEGTASINKGTIVTVKDLFYNTPARLKYLKSEYIELANVCDIMDQLAIANPNVRFKLINDKKVLLQTNGNNDMRNILGEIYGLEVSRNIIEKSDSSNGVDIRVCLVSPTINRSKKTGITLIVNNRSVRNISIINSIIMGYDTFIPIGRYPIAVVFLQIDPILIDVNVHPAKSEIKFSNEEEVKSLVINTIKQALEKRVLIPNIKEEKTIEKPTYVSQTISVNEPIYNEPKVNYQAIENLYKPIVKEEKEEAFEEVVEIKNNEKIPYLEYIGQLLGTYLLFQNEEGLFLIDQHAAAERIRYEYYYNILGNPPKLSQELLIPLIIEVTKKELLYVLNNISIFNELGFTIEEAGETSFYVRSVPIWVIDDIEEVSEKIITYLIANMSVDIKRIRNELAKSISCKGAIKANKKLSLDEINTLMDKLNKCENPYTCPHGRPSIIKLTNYEIEKMFKRVM